MATEDVDASVRLCIKERWPRRTLATEAVDASVRLCIKDHFENMEEKYKKVHSVTAPQVSRLK